MQGTYILFSTVKFGFKRSWKLTLWMCACVMRGHTGHKQSMAIARASKKASLINIFKEVFLIKLRLALYDNYSWTRCCWQTYLLKSLQITDELNLSIVLLNRLFSSLSSCRASVDLESEIWSNYALLSTTITHELDAADRHIC